MRVTQTIGIQKTIFRVAQKIIFLASPANGYLFFFPEFYEDFSNAWII